MSGGRTIANAPSGEKSNLAGTELLPISGSQYVTLAATNRIVDITTVNAATYDLLVTDNILHVTYTATGAVTSLTLPSAQIAIAGRLITIKDAGGNASVYNITIDTEGAETIDGAATLVINEDYQSVTLYSDGSNLYVI